MFKFKQNHLPPCSQLAAMAFAVTTLVPGAALAADRLAALPVSSAHIKALGITTLPLKIGQESSGTSFPAQVAVMPEAEQAVSAPIAGLVTQLLVQPNQAVKAGTPLLRMVSAELGQLQLQLLQARAQERLARQAADREKKLFEEGIIPERRVQESKAALQVAEAALAQSKAALRLSGLSPAAIAQITVHGKPQDSITLTAEKAGVVSEINVKTGQRVDATAVLLHLLQVDRLVLDIQVPAVDAGRWVAGTPVRIQGRPASAKIVSASPVVKSGSQTVLIRAAIDSNSALRPGEFVTAELPAASAAGSWDLPLVAVARHNQQAVVFVRSKQGFEARPVTVLSSAGQRVRVQGSLKAGEEVAVTGVVALKGAWLGAQESE